MTGENCLSFRFTTWNSFIGQFVHSEGGEMRVKGMDGGIVILANCKFHFFRENENLVYYPSNQIFCLTH